MAGSLPQMHKENQMKPFINPRDNLPWSYRIQETIDRNNRAKVRIPSDAECLEMLRARHAPPAHCAPMSYYLHDYAISREFGDTYVLRHSGRWVSTHATLADAEHALDIATTQHPTQ